VSLEGVGMVDERIGQRRKVDDKEVGFIVGTKRSERYRTGKKKKDKETGKI